MEIALIITSIIAVGAIGLLFVTRRLMRLAIRLAVMGGLLLVLLIGGLAWWYRAGLGSDSRQKEKPSTTRRGVPR